MGTRHLIMVELNNEFKVAQYGQWDGYPEGQGKDIINFLNNNNLEVFKEKVSKIRFGTKEEFEELQRKLDAKEITFPKEFSRDTSAKILDMIINNEVTILHNEIDFIKDSLFCEFAYNINLDTNKLEVYKGFVKTPQKGNRFGETPNDDGYYPCHLIKSYSFDNLPSVKRMKEECDPEEDDE